MSKILKLNDNDLWVINFLKNKEFVQPTRIGSAYGYFLDKKHVHSSWASPICKKLESLGILVANEKRAYKIHTILSDLPTAKPLGYFTDDSGKICTAYKDGTSDSVEIQHGFFIRNPKSIYYKEEINIHCGSPYNEYGFHKETPIHNSYVLWRSRDDLEKAISNAQGR
jgi:hypothetical protein